MEARRENVACFGVLCALAPELGTLRERVRARRDEHGLELLDLDLGGDAPVLACAGGVGKVCAARAATALVHAGARRGLLVVGVCGGLVRSLAPGDFLHAARAVQADLAVRHGREVAADPDLLAAWRGVVPGAVGWLVTADRPVLNPWRRVRLARAFAGPCGADMETAAAAAVAELSGVPWAALRAVTDRAGFAAGAGFRKNFPSQAGRAADTIPTLLKALREGGSR